MTRRDEVLDAAIDVLGGAGPRGLTHRAVDAAAGVPAGTTSNHFRSRDALVDGVVERLVALDHADWQGLAARLRPADVTELVAALDGFVRLALGPGRARTAARYALFLEAAVRPELGDRLAAGRATIHAWALRWVRAAGSTDPDIHCRIVLDYLDGVTLHRLAFPSADPDGTAALHALLAGLLPDGAVGPPDGAAGPPDGAASSSGGSADPRHG